MWFLSEAQSGNRRKPENVKSEPSLEVGQVEVEADGRNKNPAKRIKESYSKLERGNGHKSWTEGEKLQCDQFNTDAGCPKRA